MKQTLTRIIHRLDFHLLLVGLLALPAATPLIQPDTITDSADGLLHLYRLVALDHAIRQGAFFPRWLPDLAYGYGLPLFVFYAPLSYYFTLALKLLGLGAVGALNASFILALLLSGAGVYLFTKDCFGPKAGIVAGVAYVYAPIQLLNTLSRGSLPAAWAMAAFPFVFWIFGRLIRQTSSVSGVRISIRAPERNILSPLLPASALIFGIALLMHNISSLLFVPLVGLYLGLEFAIQFINYGKQNVNLAPERGQRKPWIPLGAAFLQQVVLPVGLAGILGLGLAAFFLLPAVVEKEFAQVERVITPPDFDFHFNFVTLKELLSLPKPANTGLLNPHYPLTLGLVQVGLAVGGLIGVRNWRNPKQGGIVIFATLGLVGTVLMMLPISVGVWERVPLIAFVQHPHRLLSLAALVLATLAGIAVATWPKRLRFGLTLLGIVLIFVSTAPLLYPRYRPPFRNEPTLLDMMAYEHASGAIGTTSFGEYLPRWVEQVPRESPLEPMYQAKTPIERLDRAYLPAEARIESASYGFNQAELVIDSPEPYQAIFHTFYFPGWEALVDGQPGLIAPVSERGLIGVIMPPGRHHLQLYFRETLLRRVGNLLSIVSLGVILVMSIFSLIMRPDYKAGVRLEIHTPTPTLRPNGFRGRQLAILAGLAIVLMATKIFYLDRFDNPLKHTFDGTRVAGVDVSRQVNFGGQVNLLGYDLEHQTVVSGQSFNLTLYWQARQPLVINYSSLAQLVDAERHLYAAQDNLHPGKLLTSQWQPWGFVQDPHTIPVPPGTPPGDYFLITGLYDPSTWARVPVVGGGDPNWGDVVAIPVTVAKSAQPPEIAELGITWPVAPQTSEVLETSKLSTLRLLGATPARAVIQRNDFLRVALFWEATIAPRIDYQISLRLLTEEGTNVLEETNQPSHNRYPTTRWVTGERVRDNHALWIPPDFPTGAYRLQMQVLDEAGQPISDWVELGKMETAE